MKYYIYAGIMKLLIYPLKMIPSVRPFFRIEPNLASIVIEPRTESERTFKIKVSEQVLPGVSLLLVNIKFDSWDLREWSEALIEILP